MKAYKLKTSEEEVIAANTVIEALLHYNEITDLDINDFNVTDEITEIPKSEWNDYIIKNVDFEFDEPETSTLAEIMKGLNEPHLICSTCY